MKFDENDLGLFMDFQLKKDDRWRRIKPEEAMKVRAGGTVSAGGPEDVSADCVAALLAGGEESSGAA